MQLQACFYRLILFLYIYRHVHIHTFSRLCQCVLSPVPDELQLSFDVVSVWQAVSSLALGKYLLMLEDYLLIPELCWWMVSALVANLLCYRSSCWFFLYGGCQQDPLLEEGGNRGRVVGLTEWEKPFRALWGLFQLEYTRLAREVWTHVSWSYVCSRHVLEVKYCYYITLEGLGFQLVTSQCKSPTCHNGTPGEANPPNDSQ